MPNWTTVSLDSLSAANLTGVVDAIREEAGDSGLADPWSDISAQATDELRACIGFSGKYELDADTAAIPKGLLRLVLGRIVREMSRRVGRSLSADERSDDTFYEKRLDQIRLGQWPIEPPDTPLAANTPAAQQSALSPLVSRKRRPLDRRHEDGI